MTLNGYETLKIAVVGCGRIAEIHARFLLKIVPKKNVAVCDLNFVKAKAFASAAGITNCYDSLQKLLDEFKPDICHITTPPHTHADLAICCIEHGAHVFVEKPMCVSLSEADRIIAVSHCEKKLVCVGHQRLFEKQIIKAKRILDSGKLGRVSHVFAVDREDFLQRLNMGLDVEWYRQLQGGMIFDLLPHLVYLSQYFVPGLTRWESICVRDSHNRIAAICVSCAGRDAMATLSISLDAHFLQKYIRIECTRGFIHIDLRYYAMVVTRKTSLPGAMERIFLNLSIGSQLLFQTCRSAVLFALGRIRSYEGTDSLIKAFYDAVLQNGSSPVPPEEGKKVVGVCAEALAKCDVSTSFLPGIHSNGPTVSTGDVPVLKADILVTGATGFIGRHLLDALLRSGNRVRILTRERNKRLQLSNVEVLEGDVRDEKVVDAAMKGIRVVYHLAAAMKGGRTEHFDSTVRGTKNILDSMAKHQVDRLVYLSSLCVYDQMSFSRGQVVSEEYPYEQTPLMRGYYSYAKLEAEKLVRQRMQDGNLCACIVRAGMVYGPGRDGLSVLFPHKFLKLFGRKILLVIGRGSMRLNLVYVKDLVDLLLMAGQSEEATGHIFNAVDPNTTTQGEYVRLYRMLSGEKLVSIFVPVSVLLPGFGVLGFLLGVATGRKLYLPYKIIGINKVGRSSYDVSGAQSVLKWGKHHNIKEAVRETLEWERENVAAGASS